MALPPIDEPMQNFPPPAQGLYDSPEAGALPMDTLTSPDLVMPADEIDSLQVPGALEQVAATEPELLTPEERSKIEKEVKKVDEHYDNLAENIDDNVLKTIAQDLIERVEEDDDSRKDWYDRVKEGIRNLGVSSEISGGADFEGASTVVHPVLMESCTQFQSRAIQEMWPAAGPVQTQVLGEQNPEKQDQAERVQNYMNYLYTIEMTEAFTEADNMLLRLPITGSTFKKMYHDPLKKRLSSIFVEPADFIISYQTTDLSTSPRYTHRIREYKNDVTKKENSGYYVKSKMGNVHTEDTDKPMIIDEIDKTEGKERVSFEDDEDRATMYEVYVDYDVKGVDGENKLLKPYIITIDRDEQSIKRIQRNWKPNDEDFHKRQYFTHYKFTPGLGFYGYGFLHLIGDMSITATGALRALLDAGGFSNLQGGFVSKYGRTPMSKQPLAPGEWREVDATVDELKDAFFHVPYKEPSATLFQLLSYVDEKARHLVGITDTNTGEANPKHAPVGTTAMLLEQGTKVFTAIHKRIHEANKQEFKIMAELVEEYMPDEGYPYLIGTEDGVLMPQDFDKRIDVIPVSDPNVSSNAQRVAKAQSILELQQAYPQVIKEREAVRRMLEAIQVQGIDSLIGTDEEQAAAVQAENLRQEELDNLEKEKIKIESLKMQAELEYSRSQAVKNNLEAMKAAFEAAAMAVSSTGLVAAADALMKSCGFIDKDAEGLMNPEALAALQPPQPQPGLPQEGMMPPQTPGPYGPVPPPDSGEMPMPSPEELAMIEAESTNGMPYDEGAI